MSAKTKGYLALAYVAIAWGTTYLAIRVGVLHFPAFLFAGIRQVISGLIIGLAGLAMVRRADLSVMNVRHQVLTGFLMITVGNGLVTWGERVIPSGVAALICSMMPICAVFMNLALHRKEGFNLLIVIGMVLGILGVGFIFRNDLGSLNNPQYLLGAGLTFVATFSWAFGSVLNKNRPKPVNPIFDAGLQLFAGGVFLFMASPFVDDLKDLDFWHPDVVWSMLYLIFFGSVLAYTAYMYALRTLPVGIVTLYAYINPLVAVILGYYLMSEPLTAFTGLAFVTISTGVFLVNRGYKRKAATIGEAAQDA